MASFIALMGMKKVGEELEQVLRGMRHPVAQFNRLSELRPSRVATIS